MVFSLLVFPSVGLSELRVRTRRLGYSGHGQNSHRNKADWCFEMSSITWEIQALLRWGRTACRLGFGRILWYVVSENKNISLTITSLITSHLTSPSHLPHLFLSVFTTAVRHTLSPPPALQSADNRESLRKEIFRIYSRTSFSVLSPHLVLLNSKYQGGGGDWWRN